MELHILRWMVVLLLSLSRERYAERANDAKGRKEARDEPPIKGRMSAIKVAVVTRTSSYGEVSRVALRRAWGTGAIAHDNLLKNPRAVKQFHIVKKVPAAVSMVCYAASNARS